MKNRLVIFIPLVLLVLVIPTLLALAASGRTQSTSMNCVWTFEATVRQGPNTGTALIGDLTVDIGEDGAFTGTLNTGENEPVNVVGQVVGHAISLGLELQPAASDQTGMYIFGSGAAWQQITPETDCGGVLGGTFGGPQPGDIGDWAVCRPLRKGSAGIHVSAEYRGSLC